MLVQIVSRERAAAEGTDAQQIVWIAEWHEDRVADLNAAAGQKKTDKQAVKRHKRIASELRARAEIMLSETVDTAVAA